MGESRRRKLTDPDYGRKLKESASEPSIRTRNEAFLAQIAEVLQLDSDLSARDVAQYKRAFTRDAVRRLNEGIVKLWPRNTDISSVLEAIDGGGVAGLYVGDYAPDQLNAALVRHSTYASKLLIVDPFVYPFCVKDEYNPIFNPDQFRVQTLKCANLWIQLAPWIRSGIVEVIRTPCDFDPRLQWESLNDQQKKFKDVPELEAAAEESVAELTRRHADRMKLRHLLLSRPDEEILRDFERQNAFEKVTKDQLLAHIHRLRLQDPDFLEPMGPNNTSQIEAMTTGAAYNVARLTASLANAHLVTDLKSKWKEIEYDRTGRTPEVSAWSPFAKAMQESPFRYLDHVTLDDALAIRLDGRLESLRAFLRRIWSEACDPGSFDKVNAQLLADELTSQVRTADEEWKQIDRDLANQAGALAAGLAAAGPLIGTGAGEFLAAGALLGGLPMLLAARGKRNGFQDKFPAAFFLKLQNTA